MVVCTVLLVYTVNSLCRAVKASSPILNIIAALGSVVWYIIILLNEVPVPKKAVYDVTCLVGNILIIE